MYKMIKTPLFLLRVPTGSIRIHFVNDIYCTFQCIFQLGLKLQMFRRKLPTQNRSHERFGEYISAWKALEDLNLF